MHERAGWLELTPPVHLSQVLQQVHAGAYRHTRSQNWLKPARSMALKAGDPCLKAANSNALRQIRPK